MPTLADYRADSYAFSQKASELNRKLAFAGIALIWLFKGDVGGRPELPHELILPGALIGGALASDLLQSVAGAAIWAIFSDYKERQPGASEKKNFDHPAWLVWPIDVLFYVKVGLTLIAYLFLIVFLWTRFAATTLPAERAEQPSSTLTQSSEKAPVAIPPATTARHP